MASKVIATYFNPATGSLYAHIENERGEVRAVRVFEFTTAAYCDLTAEERKLVGEAFTTKER